MCDGARTSRIKLFETASRVRFSEEGERVKFHSAHEAAIKHIVEVTANRAIGPMWVGSAVDLMCSQLHKPVQKSSCALAIFEFYKRSE